MRLVGVGLPLHFSSPNVPTFRSRLLEFPQVCRMLAAPSDDAIFSAVCRAYPLPCVGALRVVTPMGNVSAISLTVSPWIWVDCVSGAAATVHRGDVGLDVLGSVLP
eukprot:GHVT01082571.1.p1 GENE.GHVT01082571.1~~GHVT01082571.1.p1  ORF type:complete len:106 (-),score=9.20 GHVT01082571.1:3345-3662(-)